MTLFMFNFIIIFIQSVMDSVYLHHFDKKALKANCVITLQIKSQKQLFYNVGNLQQIKNRFTTRLTSMAIDIVQY